jgi:uncharacterized RDD family membrane protein YckC
MTPGLLRRLASACYDGLLLLAVLFAASFVFLAIFGDATHAPLKHFYQACLWLIAAAYFVGFWLRGGQTLAMRTWRIRLVSASGEKLSSGQALLRFTLAPLGLLLFCWAWLDREGCFLHDRLAGTRLVMV